MEKLKVLLKQKKVIVGVGIGIIILIVIGIIIANANASNINFALKDNVIEYGEEASEIDWMKKADTNATKISASLDTKKIGKSKVEFDVCIDDDCEKMNAEVEIKDTKAPEIKFKKESIEIEQDSEFDPVDNIESVKDIIDGDLKKSDKEIEKDGYFITGKIESNTVGKYTVKVIAIDKNANKSEKEYAVVVKEKTENSSETEQNSSNTSPNEPNGNNGNTGSTSGQGAQTGSNTTTAPSNNTPSPAPQPAPEPAPQPTPEPTPPPTELCPNGFNPAWPCDKVISGSADEPSNSGMWFGSMEEADAWAESESYKVGGQWEGYGWAIFDVEYNDGRQKWTVFFH